MTLTKEQLRRRDELRSRKSASLGEQQLTGGGFEGVADEKPFVSESFSSGFTEPEIELPQEQKRLGFLGTIGQRLERRAGRLTNIVEETASGRQTTAEAALQTGGEVAGGAFDIAGAALEQISPSPEAMKGFSDFFDLKRLLPANSRLSKDLEESQRGFDILASQGQHAFEQFREENPRAARNVDALANLALISPLFRGSKVVSGAGEAFEASGKMAIEQNRQSFVRNLVSPIRDKSTKIAQVPRTTEAGSGFFKRSIIKPTSDELLAEQAVLKIPSVKAGNTVQGNFNIIQEANQLEAIRLENRLAANDFIYPRRELLSNLKKTRNGLAENPLITGDAEQLATKLINKVVSLVNESPAKGSRLLKVRKDFDKWIKSQKGTNVFDPKNDTALSISLRDIRRTINDFIDTKATNVGVKKSLAEQRSLFTAMENVGKKAALEADTAVGRILQKASVLLGTKNRIVQIGAALFGIGGLGAASTFALPAVIAFGTGVGLLGLRKLILHPKLRVQMGKLLKEVEKRIPNTVDTTQRVELINIKDQINELLED